MQNIKKVHIIGVCGTLMGSLAVAMKDRGFEVTGSDAQVYPPMSTYLEENGVQIMNGFCAENISDDIDLVVVGNAIGRGNEELEEVLNKKMLYASTPEVLKQFFLHGKSNICISGTHGKTTTTTLTTWLFKVAEKNPAHLIGGVPKNFPLGMSFPQDTDYTILESDEYDTSFFDKRSKFLQYLPETVVINSIEFDHADIFETLDDILLTFSRLVKIVPQNGLVIINGDDENCEKVLGDAHAPIKRVGFNPSSDVVISDVSYTETHSTFKLNGEEFTFTMVGEFNVKNAAMAIVVSQHYGIDNETIQKGLSTFEGIARRQEVRGIVDGVVVIDDFAHHPTAVEGVIKTLKTAYPKKKLWVLFEAGNSNMKRDRVRGDLAKSLSGADEVIIPNILDAHKVTEEPLLDLDLLVQNIVEQGVVASHISDVEEIARYIAQNTTGNDVVAVLSCRGFDGVHNKILEELKKKTISVK
jgi:UDP-N-acetylmuramate: L-alanyl-gamma-D-glutamyl-meso-diaminopimelate ligase